MNTMLLSEIFPPATGGSGRWFWEVYRRLPRDRFFLAVGEHPEQETFDATHDLRVERLPLASPRWDLRSVAALGFYLRTVRRLRRLARANDVTHLHCGRVLPEGWLAWLLKTWTGRSYSCYVHGEDVETAATSRELSWMVRRVLGGADRLICNSHNSARLLRENWGVPDGKIVVLHPGVDATRFVPAERSPEVRRELGWGDRPVLMTVGRLQQRKGHDMLIRALPAIRAVHPDVLYVIVGTGEERESLERLAADLGVTDHVSFLGGTDDETMIRCYQQCDLFVLPNRAVGRDIEGFGIVLLEAQACGRPVIAGDSGGTAETMEPGVTGFVVDCTRPEPLEETIVRLLVDPETRDRMGRAGRERIESRFDWMQLAGAAGELFGVPLEQTPTALFREMYDPTSPDREGGDNATRDLTGPLPHGRG